MDWIQRIKGSRAFLEKTSVCEALWIEQPVDLLYLTGLSLSKGTLWVDRGGATLFVDGRYLEMARAQAPCTVLPETDLPQWLAARGTVRVGVDSCWTSYEAFLKLQKTFAAQTFVPLPHPLQAQRAIKDGEEKEALRKAAQLTKEGIAAMTACLKEGITEEEVALEFEIFCRRRGASGLSFEPIVAFGPNSAFPHHRATSTPLRPNQMVLFDVGAVVGGYRGDFTRMVHFGTPPQQLLQWEAIVAKGQKKAIEQIRPGVRVGALDEVVRTLFAEEGVEEFFTHGLGHGVGLETHEFPRLKAQGEDRDVLLEAGMVITIEPGLYQAGLGGIRIEDMVFVTDNGYTLL